MPVIESGVVCPDAGFERLAAALLSERDLCVISPSLECMMKTPSIGGCADTIFHLKRVAEFEEFAAGAGGRGEGLPVPDWISQGTGDVIEMSNVFHPELSFESIFLSMRPESESEIEVCDNAFYVCGTVLGHVLADGLEVAPVVGYSLGNTGRGVGGPEDAGATKINFLDEV
jgi:hypothetical protein